MIQVSNYQVGSKAIYSCINGLELIGNNERTCQTNGQWSGQIPYCRCKFYRVKI